MDDFWPLAKLGIFKITKNLYQGLYPEKEALEKFKLLGIKTTLNFASGSYKDEFFLVYHLPFPDLEPIPLDIVEKSIEAIALSVKKEEKIFIHCVAGQNRSVNILWFYLLACGFEEEEAILLIDEKTLDANPKHSLLITPKLIKFAKNLNKTLSLNKTIC